jgi:sensor histidine kinase YesM
MHILIKKISYKVWLWIFAIWTLAALSLSVQVYLNNKIKHPEVQWFPLFLKQLPAWYLCALLTRIIIFIYDRFPFNTTAWRKNIVNHFLIALLILSVFSHLRVIAMAFITDTNVWEHSIMQYLNTYLAQIAWDFIVYCFIVTGIFADRTNNQSKLNALNAEMFKLKNKELENQLNLAQLEALKLQLSPHFLFNTLNTINSLIRSGETIKAIQINTRLGDFLRSTLYANPDQFVPLKKELEFVSLYLSIELVRFEDRLLVQYDIEPACHFVPVPYFILHPLVENAVKHGISKSSRSRLLLIEAKSKDEKILIRVFNDGYLEDKIEKPINKTTGIGLRNVQSRLKKIYGEHYLFSIKNKEDKGVEVNLAFPINHEFNQSFPN